MKKSFGTKIDRAIAKAYTDLYKQIDFIKFSAKQIAGNEFSNEQEFEDLLNDITREYQEYKNLKKYIELLEFEEGEDI